MSNLLDRVPLNEVVSLRLLGMETPTLYVSFSEAFRWIREKHSWLRFRTVDTYDSRGVYEYDIQDIGGVLGFQSYEEAELACLKRLIEVLENGKKYKAILNKDKTNEDQQN